MERELYINGRRVDLLPEEPFAITFQSNDIADAKSRQANHSRSFRLPQTDNNLRSIYFSHKVGSVSNLPYRKNEAYYIERGLPLIQNGVAILDNFSEGYLNVTVYSGIYDFFDIIEGKTLKDIDWSELNHDFTLAEVINKNNQFGNITWPLIQWGAYRKGYPVDIRSQVPCVKYSYVVDKILEYAGYTISGDVLNEELYKAMYMTLNTEEVINSEELAEANSAKLIAHSDGDTIKKPFPNSEGYVNNFISVSYSLFNLYRHGDDINGDPVDDSFIGDNFTIAPTVQFAGSGTQPVYVAFSNIDQVWNVNLNLLYWAWLPGYPDTLGEAAGLYIFVNGVEKLRRAFQITGSDIDQDLQVFQDSISLNVSAGDELMILVVVVGNGRFKLYQQDSFIEVLSENAKQIGQEVNYNSIIPEISMKDFMLNFARIFALNFNSNDDLVLYATMFKEIKQNIPEAKNWSNKLDKSKPINLSYRIGNYAQNNYFMWADDNTNGFGDGIFAIDDQTLQLNNSFVELIFSASLPEYNIFDTINQPVSGHTGIKIPRYTLYDADQWRTYESYQESDIVQFGSQVWIALRNTTGDEPGSSPLDWELFTTQYEATEDSNTRLVIVRRLEEDSTSPAETITFTDGDNESTQEVTTALLAYFKDGERGYLQLGGETLLSRYYSEIQEMVRQLKYVTCYMNLDITDVGSHELDFTKPVYIEYFGNYFYLNRIENFISGQSTLCHFIRI